MEELDKLQVCSKLFSDIRLLDLRRENEALKKHVLLTELHLSLMSMSLANCNPVFKNESERLLFKSGLSVGEFSGIEGPDTGDYHILINRGSDLTWYKVGKRCHGQMNKQEWEAIAKIIERVQLYYGFL